MKYLLNLVKEKWIEWLINGVRSALLSVVSYYLLKLVLKIDILEEFLNHEEKHIISTYILINTVTGFILFESAGILIEYFFNKKNNNKYFSIFDSSLILKDLKKFYIIFFKFLIKVNLITEKDLDDFEIELDINLPKVLLYSKKICGLFIICIPASLIFYDFTYLAIWISIISFSLAFFSVLVLYILYALKINFDKYLLIINSSKNYITRKERIIKNN
ncbi:MAG: hypothetical protein U0U66_03875 [Cytophagaceae bacterium]